jgi:hypothetical protein
LPHTHGIKRKNAPGFVAQGTVPERSAIPAAVFPAVRTMPQLHELRAAIGIQARFALFEQIPKLGLVQFQRYKHAIKSQLMKLRDGLRVCGVA